MKSKILFFLFISIFCFSSFAQKENKNVNWITKKLFGTLDNGMKVYLYTLHNQIGAELKVTNFGATVVSLTMPDRNGNYKDIVLGYDSLKSYENGTSYFGAIVGRYANRISKGKIKIDDKTYQLSVNEGENQLHGGKVGFNKMLWTAKTFNSKIGPSIKLTLVSPDGDQGYPGKVILNVTYTLTNNNELKINYEGSTNKTTILNPSHHSYFNLTGDFTKTILEHQIKIDANEFTPINKEFIPTGKLENVVNTPLDFRNPTAIGAHINDNFEQLKFAHGYDFNWVLNNYNKKIREVADVYEPTTGRYMQVFTDQPGLQFYSGNFLNGSEIGKNGIHYNFRTGFCLEAQHYPDSPNEPQWPSVILKPGQIYRQITIYKFSTK